MRSASINQLRRLLSSLSPSLGQLLQINIWAPRKIGATHPTPQNCRQMIPLRSRSDSWTFTPEPHAIRIESNFSRCPFVVLCELFCPRRSGKKKKKPGQSTWGQSDQEARSFTGSAAERKNQ